MNSRHTNSKLQPVPTFNSSKYGELPDQQTLGPGQWFTIHKIAKCAINESKKQMFVEFMNDVCEEMRCGRCKQHMIEYMRANPFSPFWNVRDRDGSQVGMFKWTWLFHNSVNERLNKPFVDWDTAKHMFYSKPPASPVPTPLGNLGNKVCTGGGCPENELKQASAFLPSTLGPSYSGYGNWSSPSHPPFSVLQALSKANSDPLCSKFGICKI